MPKPRGLIGLTVNLKAAEDVYKLNHFTEIGGKHLHKKYHYNQQQQQHFHQRRWPKKMIFSSFTVCVCYMLLLSIKLIQLSTLANICMAIEKRG